MLADDERAFREFFEGQFPRLHNFAFRRLGGREDATEEVVQAVLARAVQKLDTFRGESTLTTWLCAMCRREIADWNRERRRRGTREVYGIQEDVRVTAENRESAGGENPEESVVRDEEAARIRAVLDGLPESYGEVLEWKYIEGLSVKEIALRLGGSPKAAESTLTRARVAFRAAFAEHGSGKAPA
jgi:RNA polymerase sigma-70 factor (ECF subfamily)